jgi:serine/threonine protein kinase
VGGNRRDGSEGKSGEQAAMNRTDARAEALFRAALAISGGGDRDGLIAAECGDDLALEMRVRRLLREHEDADAAPEKGALAPEIEAELERLKPEEEGERIGAYKLREQLGEGGFGTVWVADQEVPVRRRVALKIIKLGMDTKEVIARFEQERQALAMMDHPNIARVLDAGATQFGRPFFVMELVRGIPITDYCDQANLATTQRLELFIQVCQAVQHAHQKGIIHRDLSGETRRQRKSRRAKASWRSDRKNRFTNVLLSRSVPLAPLYDSIE